MEVGEDFFRMNQKIITPKFENNITVYQNLTHGIPKGTFVKIDKPQIERRLSAKYISDKRLASRTKNDKSIIKAKKIGKRIEQILCKTHTQ